MKMDVMNAVVMTLVMALVVQKTLNVLLILHLEERMELEKFQQFAEKVSRS